MPVVLATDPGAWNIIGWILILAVIGSAVLWVVSTLLLRTAGASEAPAARPGPRTD